MCKERIGLEARGQKKGGRRKKKILRRRDCHQKDQRRGGTRGGEGDKREKEKPVWVYLQDARGMLIKTKKKRRARTAKPRGKEIRCIKRLG